MSGVSIQPEPVYARVTKSRTFRGAPLRATEEIKTEGQVVSIPATSKAKFISKERQQLFTVQLSDSPSSKSAIRNTRLLFHPPIDPTSFTSLIKQPDTLKLSKQPFKYSKREVKNQYTEDDENSLNIDTNTSPPKVNFRQIVKKVKDCAFVLKSSSNQPLGRDQPYSGLMAGGSGLPKLERSDSFSIARVSTSTVLPSLEFLDSSPQHRRQKENMGKVYSLGSLSNPKDDYYPDKKEKRSINIEDCGSPGNKNYVITPAKITKYFVTKAQKTVQHIKSHRRLAARTLTDNMQPIPIGEELTIASTNNRYLDNAQSPKNFNIVLTQQDKQTCLYPTPHDYYNANNIPDDNFHSHEFFKHIKENHKALRSLVYDRMEEKPECTVHKFERTKPLLLALDLDETLVHSLPSDAKEFDRKISYITERGVQQTTKLNIRPHLHAFLVRSNRLYDMVVFTASDQQYADAVVELIDPKRQFFKKVFTRIHCVSTDNGYRVKDLRAITGDHTHDVLLVDNSAQCFYPQLDNGIPILPFYSDKNDNELLELAKFLERVANEGDPIEYVREYFGLYQYAKFNDTEELVSRLKRKRFT